MTRTCTAWLLSASLIALMGTPMPTLAGEDSDSDSEDGAPSSATVRVDCAAGESIQAALDNPALELTIEIDGTCHENVLVRRDNVILRGKNGNPPDPPTDGIQGLGIGSRPLPNPLNVLNTFLVTIENLKLTGGGAGGLGVDYSFAVNVINCRLEDNNFVGAFVHASRVNMVDTVITGNGNQGVSVSGASLFGCTGCMIQDNPGGGVRFGRGISARGASRILLTDSTIQGDRRGVFISDAGLLLIVGSATSIESTPDDLQRGEAILAINNIQVDARESSIVGPIVVGSKSAMVLQGVTQTIPGTFSIENTVSDSSTLRAASRFGPTTLAGNLHIGEFSNAVIQGLSTTVQGDLVCASGGDAFCDDPAVNLTGASNCASCVTPPPCVATTAAEYIISGGTDPNAGIFVDDFLRVFLNGPPITEVSNGGRCCPPAAPIHFAADTGDTLRLQARDGNNCYSLEALYLQKADGSCLTELTGDIFGPSCGSEPPEQIFFDESFALP